MTTPPTRQRPTFIQAITITGAGLLVAFFGCLGAIAGFSNGTDSALGTIGAIGFGMGALVFVVGTVLLFIVLFRAIFGPKAPEPSVVTASTPRESAAIDPPPPPAADTPGPPEGE